MTRIKVEQTLEMSTEDIEKMFSRPITPPTPTSRKPHYTIVANLTPNRASVINQCKAALVRQFGMEDSARYIAFRETTDPRGIQYWLKYQIERTPYADEYCLLAAAQKWLDGAQG